MKYEISTQKKSEEGKSLLHVSTTTKQHYMLFLKVTLMKYEISTQKKSEEGKSLLHVSTTTKQHYMLFLKVTLF